MRLVVSLRPLIMAAAAEVAAAEPLGWLARLPVAAAEVAARQRQRRR